MSNYLAFTIIAVSCAIILLSDATSVERTIKNGQILGEVLKSHKGQDYYSFKGIPFAEPPVGKLRFQPPKATKNWEGILNTTSDTKICHQIANNPERLIQDEDCLYINVYAPKQETLNEKMAVMVWIHGGGFLKGHSSSSLYGPDYFMDYDVIIVTFNYRLGIFGFLSTEDLVLPGNAGLKDQLLALKWINENIQAFGGDPSKVTIFGQSAGSASVSYLLSSKQTKDLYRAAISQSGTSFSLHAFEHNPKKIAHRVAKLIDPNFNDTSNSQKLLDFFLELPAEKLLNASVTIVTEDPTRNNLFSGNFFTPVIEPNHSGAMLTKSMFEIFENGEFNRVPHMIGFNSEEALGFAAGSSILNPYTFKNYLKTWDSEIERLTPNSLNIVSLKKKNEIGALIKNMYVGNGSFINNPGAAIRFASDNSITRPLIKEAILQSNYTDVYFYKFSYDGILGQNNISVPGAEYVSHLEDAFYLWKVQNIDINLYPKEDFSIHEKLLKLWTNFAKTTNPTPEKDNTLENITWPLFSANKNETLYLDINTHLSVKNNPRATFWKWDAIYRQFGCVPFYSY